MFYGALSASQHSSPVHALPKAAAGGGGGGSGLDAGRPGVAGALAGDISLTHAGAGKGVGPGFT